MKPLRVNWYYVDSRRECEGWWVDTVACNSNALGGFAEPVAVIVFDDGGATTVDVKSLQVKMTEGEGVGSGAE